MKDVTNSTLTEIKVDFTPATISVDYEAVEKQLAAVVAQYEGYEVTASTYKADFDERTRLNRLKEALEKRRKEINNIISEPYKDFKKWYDKTVKPLDDIISGLTEGLNAIEENERLLRVDTIRATFEQKCELAELPKNSFEDKYDSYSLKKYFKAGKMELKKSTLEEIDALVLAEYDALEVFKANKQVISEQALEYKLPEESYIRLLEDGKPLVDVLKIMKADRDKEIMRQQQREAREKAEAERVAEIERQAKENANAQIVPINADTGEILESGVIVPPASENAVQDELEGLNDELRAIDPVSYDLRLTFPGGNPQARIFKEWLENQGISFETLIQGTTYDELTGGNQGGF